ncbi:hypothetical protein EHS25_008867 [Saitozyma podzolica]|uniref:J domain-containing protein n=1 Tax=Saitozyma podzolica TaxID=1890683 RepID=A0A427YN26_9TREE|nr:hypothetical protein EHS25_008867 [Saitozyma podzolica]
MRDCEIADTTSSRKETRTEKASRVYRREQRRLARENERISRANGYAVSPPRQARDESISPPRNPPRHNRSSGRDRSRTPRRDEDEDEEIGHQDPGYAWMGGYGRSAAEHNRRREQNERMAYLAEEEMSRENPFSSGGGNGFGFRVGGGLGGGISIGLSSSGGLGGGGTGWRFGFSFGNANDHDELTSDVRIPRRHRDAAASSSGFDDRSRGWGRNAAGEVRFEGGAVPDIGSFTEEEYAEWIRMGMYRRKHRSELDEAEKRRQAKLEQEKLRAQEKERARKEEKKRIEKLKRQKGLEEEKKRKNEREWYRKRWAAVVDVGGEVELVELAFGDIPWPVYRQTHGKVGVDILDEGHIRDFLRGLAADLEAANGGGNGDDNVDPDMKKTLREAIRAFHPDRFFARILPRVRERDREAVREGVEVTSRVITTMSARA